jgi:regulatory protein
MKLGLKVEQEFSDEEIEKIIKKAEFQKTYDKIIRFATLRPRSRKEIELWLRRKKVHTSLHKGLFNRLKRLELLDDTKFAKWWVDQRTEFKPKGKRALFSELRQKGIDRKIIDKVLANLKIDEVKVATKILEAKMYKWENSKGLDKRKKMSDFLARRGFNWEVIKKVLNNLKDKG